MSQLLSKLRVSQKTLTTILLSVLILSSLGGLGYRLFSQWKSIEGFQNQIKALPTASTPVSQEKIVELEKDRITLENSALGTLVQAVGGLLLFLTAYVSFQNLKATQKNVLIAEEKQVTERFTQSINLLGNEKIEVQLGGIYALERVAKDSYKDSWAIIQILASLVRKRVPMQDLNSLLSRHDEIERLDQYKDLDISIEVQAALTVLGQLNSKNDLDNQRIDLKKTNLSWADLKEADLRKSILTMADLSRADLRGANLDLAFLNLAKLKGAQLGGASLRGANLRFAKLIEADLNEANLSRADLSSADFTGADLKKVNLEGAILRLTNLVDVNNLTDAQLSSSKLCKTKLPSDCNLNPDRDCLEIEEFKSTGNS
jgi:uncharacterized protein YjbI with pentapeptide repeats